MHSIIKCLVFFSFLASYIYSPAQTNNPQYNFKHLNVQNGLAQNIVYHFLQDSKGYMWLGTRNGLTIYDGVSTVNFMHDEDKTNSIASNFITRILEDSAHQLWIGNEKGIDLFNRNTNTFTHYGVDRPDGKKDNTFCLPLRFISAGEFWFIDPKTKSIRAFNTTTKSTHFICEVDAIDGVLYIDSIHSTVHFWSYLSNGTTHLIIKDQRVILKEIFFSGNGNTFPNLHLEVAHVLPQNDTTTWLCTTKGLICLNAVANTYKIYNVWNGKPVEEIRFSALTSANVLWLGSGPSGVYTFDVTNRQFVNNFTYDKSNPFSICSNNIVSLYFDRSGNIWCGSYGNGASYASVENNFFLKYLIGERESSNNILWLGLDDHDNCWCIVNDQNGFWVFDKTFAIVQKKVPFDKSGKIFNGIIYKLLFDGDENIWCATNRGLFLYNSTTNQIQQANYPALSDALFGSYFLKDIIKLHDGSIIFSTYSGLYKIEKENGRPKVSLYSQLNKLQDNSFSTLYQDEADNVYVKGDDSLFILKSDRGVEEPALLKSIALPLDIYQFFNDTVQQIIYLATNNGLYVLDKNNLGLRKEIVDERMPFKSISSVFENDKKLWLFGENGLYYYDKRNKHGRIFTVEDDLPGNEFNVSSFSFSKGDKCIAGSTNGLVSFYPDRFQKNIYPPHVQLVHIYINDVLYTAIANINDTGSISLSYRQNTFAFDFGAIAFQHNSECSFEYKLENYDDDWIKSGTLRYTRYSKIPPGKYTFQLRVYDVNGLLSPFKKSIEIQIAKAFWQTNLFRFTVLIMLLFIGRSIVKWYLAGKIRKQKIIFEKQQAVEQERTRIALEMHDDLGSGLTGIRYLAAGLSLKSSSATQDTADKISISAKALVDSMNDIIWTMKSDNNAVEEVLAYIRKQVAEQLETAGLQYSFNFTENITEIKLSSEQKRNLLLISKEAIHNIIKHAGATEVCITAQITSANLRLLIKDNGKGFDSERTTPFGNGIKSMHRRAKEMNAQLNIFNGKGTIINITLPFG